MTDSFDLDRMADDLTPVRPLSAAIPLIAGALVTIGAALFVVSTLGFRARFLEAGATDPIFLLRTGLLLLLSIASLAAAAGMARPAVGTVRTGWRWAVAAAAILPIAAAIAALLGQTPLADRLHPLSGAQCLTYTIGIGLLMGAILTLWLRRGAPTSPERAGIVVGLASGSVGALAYSMHCPYNDIVYIGLWYTLAIAATTALGRIIVPHLIRW